MLTLEGTLISVFETPIGQRQDGTRYGGETKAQILAEETLNNDEQRSKLITVRVEAADPWKKLSGATIRVPVAVYVLGRDVGFRVPPGAVPEAVKSRREAPVT